MEGIVDYLSMVAKEIGDMQYSTAWVTLVIGILNCFLGYQLLKAWIGVTGFTLGALLSYSLAIRYFENALVQLGALFFGGLLVGLAAFHIYRIGVFLLCMSVSTIAASILLQPEDFLKFLVCVGIGLFAGLLGVLFVKPMVILHTSFGGGFSIAVSVASFLNKETDVKILLLGATLMMAGIVIQAIAFGGQEEELTASHFPDP